jgi:hypothetical protein
LEDGDFKVERSDDKDNPDLDRQVVLQKGRVLRFRSIDFAYLKSVRSPGETGAESTLDSRTMAKELRRCANQFILYTNQINLQEKVLERYKVSLHASGVL